MRWPFRKREETRPVVGAVALTDDEQEECQALWQTLTRADGGYYAMPEDLIDPFKRSIIALCLMGRAERFLILSPDQQSCGQACEAAAKACAIFPLSIYFYDFAVVLKRSGRVDESKAMFGECLRLSQTEKIGPVEQITLRQRDVEALLQHARRELAARS